MRSYEELRGEFRDAERKFKDADSKFVEEAMKLQEKCEHATLGDWESGGYKRGDVRRCTFCNKVIEKKTYERRGKIFGDPLVELEDGI